MPLSAAAMALYLVPADTPLSPIGSAPASLVAPVVAPAVVPAVAPAFAQEALPRPALSKN